MIINFRNTNSYNWLTHNLNQSSCCQTSKASWLCRYVMGCKKPLACQNLTQPFHSSLFYQRAKTGCNIAPSWPPPFKPQLRSGLRSTCTFKFDKRQSVRKHASSSTYVPSTNAGLQSSTLPSAKDASSVLTIGCLWGRRAAHCERREADWTTFFPQKETRPGACGRHDTSVGLLQLFCWTLFLIRH